MRIENPQNMAGKDLLVGISAININSSVASDITTIEAGSNVTLSVNGAVLTVNADVDSVAVDEMIMSNGTNAVAGSAIYTALSAKTGFDDFAHVAFTGDYNDLTNLPAASVASSAIFAALNSKVGFDDLAHIAFTGDYNDLTNLPEVVVVVDSVITSSGTNAVTGSAVYAHVVSTLSQAGQGDMLKSEFVNGDGVVKSAVNASNATSATNATTQTVGDSSTKIATTEFVTNVVSTHSAATGIHVPAATVESAGKVLKVNGGGVPQWLDDSAGTGGATVDSVITSDGENAVAGSAIYVALSAKANTNSLAQIAFTGNYADLTSAPFTSIGSGLIVSNGILSVDFENGDLFPI